MALIIKQDYPDAETYKGEAYYTAVEFTTSPLSWIYNDLPNELIRTSLEKVEEGGGKPLSVLVWRENRLFDYKFTVGVYYYIVNPEALTLAARRAGLPLPVIPIAMAYLIIGAITLLLGLFLIGSIIKSATSLIWGREGGIPWIPIAIAVVGISIGLGYFFKTYKEFRKYGQTA